jgi:hypothetical protein
MILYHTTKLENIPSIREYGLRPNESGIIYLSPKPTGWTTPAADEIVLKVETGDRRLTAFDDCKDWEVLCWCASPIKIEGI